MKSLKQFLFEPYSFEFRTVKELFASFFVGVFIVVFLFVFEPFGFDTWGSKGKVLHLSVFGLLSWLVPFFLMLLLKKTFSGLEKNWKVWKEIVSMLLFILAIAGCCYGYLVCIKAVNPSIFSFPVIAANALLIALFPATANVYVMYRNYLSEHVKNALEMNRNLPSREHVEVKSMVTIIAENGKDAFDFETSTILYIQSTGNYVEVISLSGYRLKRTLIRSSLTRIEAQLPPDLVRCHRSTIVHLKNVRSITGNAQGYKISFVESNESVFVSRKYAQEIRTRLKK